MGGSSSLDYNTLFGGMPLSAGYNTSNYGGGQGLSATGIPSSGSDAASSSLSFGAWGGVGTAGTGTATGAGNSSSSEATNPTIDLDALAQEELLQATRVIEEIAKNLESRPRHTTDRSERTDVELTLDDISDGILDSAQSISRAAAILLKAAAVAQKERVSRDYNIAAELRAPYHVDPLWAQGLISAARYVVAATQNLVMTAESAVKGQSKEESLIAASQAVTAATAQLVAAQRAKGDINSAAHQGLENAAKGITRATAQLVHSAQLATQKQAQMSPVPEQKSNYSMTEKEVMKLEKKAKVLQLEKETERLRLELEALNKKDYEITDKDKEKEKEKNKDYI